jgi:ABC-2 type transport system permease protein
MTTISTISPASPARHDTDRVPLSRLIRVELRKMVDTRAGMWLFVAMGAITAVAVVIFLLAANTRDLTYNNFVGVTLTPQGFLLPVLGILAITSEWGQRTGLVTFTLEPSRSRVVVAKFVGALAAALLAVALGLALAAVGHLLASSTQGGGDWTFGVVGLRDITVLQVLGIIQGLAFGMLLMNSAAAISLYFVLPIAWSIIFGLVASLRDAAPWVDLSTAQAPLLDHSSTAHDWLQLAVATGIWVVVPLVLGTVRLLKSELKSS